MECLNTTETYPLTVLETRSPKSGSQWGLAPSEGSRKELVPCLSGPKWLLAIVVIPWLVDIPLRSLPVFAWLSSLCVCAQSSLLLQRHQQPDEGPL